MIYGSNNQNYILVTQPSDIATIGLSKIIANDLKEKVGNKVGYQTKWKNKFSNNTKIFIKNISKFLEELIDEKINYTHIILDEIPENDNNMDLVLTLLKMYYKSNNNQKFIKLILLTRILNNNIFLDYFIDVNQSPIPIIKFNDICYEIKTFYLNNIYMEIVKDRNIPKELSEKIKKKLEKFKNYFDNIENINKPKFMKELYNIVIGIIEQKRINISFKENKRILILLPGTDEINFLNYKLQSYFENNEISEFYNIIIFHELIDDNEQKNTLKYNEQKFNIILSNNIEEVSLIIPHIDSIIDFCLINKRFYDKNLNLNYIKLQWCSKSNIINRKYRIQNKNNISYYMLIKEEFYEQLDIYQKSEFLASSYEILILKLMMSKKNLDVNKILLNSINPPPSDIITTSYFNLEQIGAIVKNENINSKYNLTNIGRIASKLPLNIKYSRLIMISYGFGHINLGITLSAILQYGKSLFINSNKCDQVELNNTKQKFSNNNECDFFVAYNAYISWYRNFSNYLINENFNYIKLKDHKH